ncbi:TPA: 4-hydroxybenzoate octaprenyltransferase, partial [Legionella pneumophila]|nr:4-hydroxybenzoate octaprenyltransferase [Legionella pneumophila]
MIPWNAYVRLLRLNKPIGILLLWYPTAWALWMANQGFPSIDLLMIFLLGTVFMRSAGCVINDIADRHIDRHVARTQFRPLTAGEVSLSEAFILLFILLCASLLLLLKLPINCFYFA